MLPGDEGTSLLAAPLDGTGSSAIAAEFPAGGLVGAEVRELFSILTSHLAQVLAKARDYEQARAVALTLQHAILAPTELPHGFAARYTPAVPPLEVGGDWYDVIPLPGQRTGVVVGDCVGRGLPAAAVMGQLRSASQAVLLRACRSGRGPRPTWTPSPAGFPGAECATVFCAIIDPAAGTVTYSCAGHPPPILVTAGGEYQLLDQARSLPLGMLPDDWRAQPGDGRAAARRDLDAVHRRAGRTAEPVARRGDRRRRGHDGRARRGTIRTTSRTTSCRP